MVRRRAKFVELFRQIDCWMQAYERFWLDWQGQASAVDITVISIIRAAKDVFDEIRGLA